MLATAGVAAAGERSPDSVGAFLTQELLARENFAIYRVDDVEAVHYAEAAAALGAARIAALSGDEAAAQGLLARWRRARDIPNTKNHVDANVIGAWPLALYRLTNETDLLAEGLVLADGQWEKTRNDGLTAQARLWIDDVWMIGALQIEAYKATGEARFLGRAAKTAAAYIERLQQPNGLFHHGPEAPFFWGRGNGWVAAGLAEVLSELPENHADYEAVAAGYRKMMAALLSHQAESGMWRQLVDRPDSWEESSATAMFGYAMVVGARRGLLTDPAYTRAYEKAWAALLSQIDENGRVMNVCVGTGQSDEVQYYLDRPAIAGDLHGQAPALWFAAALMEE